MEKDKDKEKAVWPVATDESALDQAWPVGRPSSAASHISSSLGKAGSATFKSPIPDNIEWNIKTFFICVGVLPSQEELIRTRNWDPTRHAQEWLKAFAWSLLFAGLYVAGIAVSDTFFHKYDFSSVWLPNGITVGAMVALDFRVRTILPLMTFVVNGLCDYFLVQDAKGPSYAKISLALAAVNLFEYSFVARTTLFLSSIFSKRAGVRVNLGRPWHVVAFGIGLCWVFVANVLYAQAMMVMSGVQDTVPFYQIYIRWMDVAPVCLFAPFIIMIFRRPPSLNAIRRHPERAAAFFVLAALCVIVPLLVTIYVRNFGVVSTVVGLYLSQPLILLSAPISGLTGATFCALAAGLTAIVTIPWSHDQYGTSSQPDPYDLQNHVFFAQVCCLVTSFSALIFSNMLEAVNRARASVEKKVVERTAQLAAAQKTAEAADKAKANFIHFLCHELRNPLHAVSALTETLLEEEEEKNQAARVAASATGAVASPADSHVSGTKVSPRGFDTTVLVKGSSDPVDSDPLRAVHLCTVYMLALLSDVLDAGRFESGTVKLESRPTDVREMFEGLFAMAAEVAKNRGIKFEINVAQDVPRYVLCDQLRLQQTVNNLVSNSIKFTKNGGSITVFVGRGSWDSLPDGASSRGKLPAGSVLVPLGNTLDKRGAAIAVDSSSWDEFVLQVSCKDTGIGIRPEVLSTVFLPWTQANTSTTRDYGGSGLGLAISAQIIELMKGEIHAESELGVGTTFTFSVPLLGSDGETVHPLNTQGTLQLHTLEREGSNRIVADAAYKHAVPVRTGTPVTGRPGTPALARPGTPILRTGTPVAAIHRSATPSVVTSAPDPTLVLSPSPETPTNLLAPKTQLSLERAAAVTLLPTPSPAELEPAASTSPVLANGTLTPVSADKQVAPSSEAAKRTRRILITDDSAINRKILAKMVKTVISKRVPALPDEWVIDEAENGQESVDKVSEDLNSTRNIALVLMDVVMPIRDGYDATRGIRQLVREMFPNSPKSAIPGPDMVLRSVYDVPVVITTANQVSGPHDPDQEWVRSGADEAMSKPFGKEKVEAVLNHYCFDRDMV